MKKHLVSFVFISLVILSISFGIGCTTATSDTTATQTTTPLPAAPIVWRFWSSIATAPTFPPDWHAETWGKEITEKSNGRMSVKVYYAADLPLKSTEFLKVVGGNYIQAGYSGAGYMQGDLPQLTVYQNPFFIKTPYWDNLFKIIDDPQMKANRDAGFAKVNCIELSAYSGEENVLLTKFPVDEASDLAGKKLRAWATELGDLWKALGASASTIAFGELYLSLSSGLVEGDSNTLTTVKGQKLWEVVKYILDAPIICSYASAVVNKDAYNALPADLRMIVDEATVKFTKNVREEYLSAWKSNLPLAQQNGMQLMSLKPGELDKIIQVAKPLWIKKAAGLKGDSIPAWNRACELMGYTDMMIKP